MSNIANIDKNDVLHPTDHGFASMAKVFGDLLEKMLVK